MMIKELCNVFSPSGQEENMREYISKSVSDVFDNIKVDNIGNLICQKEGKPRSLCIECGMDSCGVMVVSKSEGKAFFSGVSGVSAAYIVDKKVTFKNGEVGVVRYDGKSLENAKLTELYIEMNTQNIRVGDFGVVAAEYFEDRDKIFANGLGSKIPIAAVVKAVKESQSDKELTVIFSAQHRFAAKGIKAFFGANEFDKVITVDGASCEMGAKSGEGCLIVALDKTGVSDKGLRDKTENITSEAKIKSQTAVTDENLCIEAISTAGKGTSCVAFGVPVLHKGKTYESVMKTDFDSVVALIKACIENL